MDRLNELIQEFCPNGVEYKKVKETFRRLRGTPITAGKMKEIEDPNGEIKIFAGGKTIINAKEENIPNANITRVPAVLVQSRGVIDVVYYDKPFTFKNEMWAYTADNKIEVKYLYYGLKNNIQSFRDAASGMGSLPQISLPVTEDFRIPLPPLPVQQEIVRILDSFTELTARRKQYEYYRDELLTAPQGGQKMKFDDLFEFQNGFAFKSSLFKESGCPILRITNIQDRRIDTEKMVYFSPDDYKENLQAFTVLPGDIVVAMSGATTGKIGVNHTDKVYYLNQRVGKFLPKTGIDKRYLYHLLLQNSNKLLEISLGSGAQPNLSSEKMKKLTARVPGLLEQKRIATILDKLDALCNDLTSGLPAEIAARQKQYEYYRDKLLTFQEKE